MPQITLTDTDGITFNIDSIAIKSIICNSPTDRRIETITGETVYIRESIEDIIKAITEVSEYGNDTV